MLSFSIAWKTVKSLGPAWALERIKLAAQLRFGVVERRLPSGPWDFGSSDWLWSPGSQNDEDLKQSLIQKSNFFFEPDHLPQPRERADVMRQAQDILEGRFPYFSHSSFEIGFPPDWHLNALNGKRVADGEHWSQIDVGTIEDVKFVWEPNRFAVVYSLVRAYAAEKDEQYAEAFWNLVEDWARANPPNTGVNWASGQEAAIRVMAWCFGLYGFLGASCSHADRVRRLLCMIEKHGERIAGFIDYALSQRNNHGISEAAGLFTIGILFPQLRRSSNWAKMGRELLVCQLDDQVYEDGSYIQHSFNYQRVALDNLVWAFRLGELNNCRFPDECYGQLERLTGFLLRFCDAQNGKMPNYGSNDGSSILPLTSCDYIDFRPSIEAAYFLAHQAGYFAGGPWNELTQWLFAREAQSFKGKISDARPTTLTVPTGYIQLRGRESWALLRAAQYRNRPSQADQLHLDLWWNGENIACDAGTYLYNGPPPWTNAFSSTAVHNTVTVSDGDQMTRAGRFLWLDWAQAESLRYKTGEADVVETWHNGYSRIGIEHRRAVLNIAGEDFWIVIDDILGKSETNVRLHWLFPDLSYESSHAGLRITTPRGAFKCVVNCSSAAETTLVRASEVAAGDPSVISDQEMETRGWRSLYYGHKEPALSLAVKTHSPLPIRFVTVLSPACVGVKAEGNQIQAARGQAGFICELNKVGLRPTVTQVRNVTTGWKPFLTRQD